MKLNVERFKKISKQEIEVATIFAITNLISDQERLSGCRMLVKPMSNVADMCHVYATMTHQNNNFLIEINPKISKSMVLKKLFHELTHVKQIIHGELAYLTEDTYVWKSVRRSTADEDYWFAPHEIEAHGYETVLFHLWETQIMQKV